MKRGTNNDGRPLVMTAGHQLGYQCSFAAPSTRHLHTYHHQPPPLACICEVGVVLPLFHSGQPLRHHPFLLANAGGGWFFVGFTRNGHYITTATPSCLQTRGGGSFCADSVWDGRYVTTTTPSRFQMRGWGRSLSASLGTAATSRRPPPLACKCEVGSFSISFAQYSRHVMTTTTLAHKCEVGVVLYSFRSVQLPPPLAR